MITLRQSSTQLITRDLAVTYATMQASPTEREFSDKRLKYLQQCYDAGDFLTCTWASVYLGGSQLRMNGQHSSRMLMALPDPFPADLYAHVDEYVAEHPADMAKLFRHFDARSSARSAQDVSAAYQHSYAELQDIPIKTAKLGAEGIAWYMWTIEGVPMGHGDDRYAMFNRSAYYDFLHWLGLLLTIKTPELRRVETVAAMYATEVKNSVASRHFWEEVARGGNQYEDQHPTTVLDKWLKACREGACDDTMKKAYHYQGCIFAWNAFREERTIKDIRFTTAKGLYTPVD